MRVEREAARRGNASTIVMSILSQLVVVAAVAAVAYLVLRTPSTAVDSAERLEPVGTAISAPTELPTLPTQIPTEPPQLTAPGFTGDEPTVDALPTVETPEAAPQEAVSGPTPTPRVIALPTEPPAAQAAPAPTLPPAAPVNSVPVEALAPVESAPLPAPTQVPVQTQNVNAPTPQPTQDDPFGIFQEDAPRIAPAQSDAMATVRAMQDQNRPNRNDKGNGNQSGTAPTFALDDGNNADPLTAPTPIVPVVVPSTSDRNGAVEVQMPDVQATVDAITAQTLDPKRNPNVGDAGRVITGRDQTPTSSSGKRKKGNNRKTPTPTAGSRPNMPVIQPGGPGNNRGNDDCPFANLPEDQRPSNWPFDDCS